MPRTLTAIALAAALGTALATAAPLYAAPTAPVELAARPIGGDTDTSKAPDAVGQARTPGKRWQSGVSILRIQKTLADLGLYLGSINGHLNDETRAAIRVYQKGAGLKADGKVSRDLLGLMQNAAKVRHLLRRLDRARKSGKNAARQALLSHPATRDLIQTTNKERADPTRDTSACRKTPTVRCLLGEASESVKAVFRPELRDWALGEILVAEARAGLTEAALLTARRIRDPRLIMVALRDIAEASAEAGLDDEALEAARIIPDPDKRLDAMAAIGDIQIRRGQKAAARTTVKFLLARLDDTDSPLKRIISRTRAAVILIRADAATAAEREMTVAETEARALSAQSDMGMALRFVASAFADMERPDRAIALSKDIPSASERTTVLVSAANALVRAGDAAAALATADTIDAVRFRAVVLGGIALAQAEKGDAEGAEATLQMALAAVEKIKIPFARSYAISRLALAMARLVKLTPDGASSAAAAEPTPGATPSNQGLRPMTYVKASETATRIDDNRLRAQTLWAIADAQRKSGDVVGVAPTEAMAEKATAEIVSKLSRVWMFGDMAVSHARRHARTEAWAAFERALEAAWIIDNAWGRSRAMARLATTLIALVAAE